jgi:cysteine synthase A
MSTIDSSILSAIGNTPLLEPVPGIFVKCEYLNPTGSIKARLAKWLVDRAEREGVLKPGDTIVEATSGNTGNALAMVAAVKGYKCIIMMPEGFSRERVGISRGLGAEVRLVEGHNVAKARQMALDLGSQDGYWCPQQFDNEWNIENNASWLAREVVLQIPTGVKIDAVVQGVGTGGTLIGVGRGLRKHHNANLQLYAMEPEEVQTIKDGTTEPHPIEGIGDGFVPDIFIRNKDDVNGTVPVKSAEALEAMKMLAQKYGTFVGPSSGANWLAAHALRARHPEIKNVLTFFCDIGEKYLSDHFV